MLGPIGTFPGSRKPDEPKTHYLRNTALAVGFGTAVFVGVRALRGRSSGSTVVRTATGIGRAVTVQSPVKHVTVVEANPALRPTATDFLAGANTGMMGAAAAAVAMNHLSHPAPQYPDPHHKKKEGDSADTVPAGGESLTTNSASHSDTSGQETSNSTFSSDGGGWGDCGGDGGGGGD